MSVSPLGQAPATQNWDAAWADALETLELDVEQAESLLAASRTGTMAEIPLPRDGWTRPALEGPMPGNLRARAEAVLARQLRVSEELARGMASTHRELQLAQRMDSGATDRSVPAYIDTNF
jgi:hypothetical protein